MHSGMIDKYLGDGFFAYWREDENAAHVVMAALSKLEASAIAAGTAFPAGAAFRSRRNWRCAVDGQESLMGENVEL